MYLHLIYYSGDRSLVESIRNKGSEGITADRTFFLNAVDNDGDALRFHLNDGSHYDVLFLHEEFTRAVYTSVLEAIRTGLGLTEMDIREKQIMLP